MYIRKGLRRGKIIDVSQFGYTVKITAVTRRGTLFQKRLECTDLTPELLKELMGEEE